MRTVIVGASLAGLRVAEGLRSNGYDGDVVLIGDEAHLPYDRPPLSKQVLLGSWAPDRVFFRTEEELRDLDIEHLRSVSAVGLDANTSGGVVRCADGSAHEYDRLVIATGARPRRVDDGTLPGVMTLRTLDDVHVLSRAFTASPRVTIVGGGFIGAEVASAARSAGLPTTVVEALPTPLSRALGEEVGKACAALYEEHGVTVRGGVTVREIVGDDCVEEVVLEDSSRIPSDLVVVGIGAVPNTEWLSGSGLAIDDGVVCDAHGNAADRVWAVGDAARWYHPLFDEHIRVEHWTHAAEQAHHVARCIAGVEVEPLSAVPYVWSDQFGVKIQIAGRPSARSTFAVANGDLDSRRFVGVYSDDDVVIGAVSFNHPRGIAQARRLIAERVDVTTAMGRLAAC
jgi:3-phenylpropionate/trans-cinnamate dioxygenase ferredoxin reductase component